MPATGAEMNEFESASTHFTLTLDGSIQSLTALGTSDEGDVSVRSWRKSLNFSAGNHTLVGRWRWDGDLIHTAVITVRADS